jgi:hypothetical protein
LSTGVALLSRFAIPTRWRRIVLRHASAREVHNPQIDLSIGVTLLGRADRMRHLFDPGSFGPSFDELRLQRACHAATCDFVMMRLVQGIATSFLAQ